MKADNGQWVGCGAYYNQETSSYEFKCQPMQEVDTKLLKNQARRGCEAQGMSFDSVSLTCITQEENDGL